MTGLAFDLPAQGRMVTDPRTSDDDLADWHAFVDRELPPFSFAFQVLDEGGQTLQVDHYTPGPDGLHPLVIAGELSTETSTVTTTRRLPLYVLPYLIHHPERNQP